MLPNRESGPQNQPSPKVAVSLFDGNTVSIRGKVAACVVDGMVFFFLSESSAVEDGHKTVFCSAGLLFLAYAYRVMAARPARLRAASRIAPVTHLQTDVFISFIRISPLFEGNMKGDDIFRSLPQHFRSTKIHFPDK